MVVHKIDQGACVYRFLFARLEIHIGDVAGTDLELIKAVDCNLVIIDQLFRIDIGFSVIKPDISAGCSGNPRHRRGQYSKRLPHHGEGRNGSQYLFCQSTVRYCGLSLFRPFFKSSCIFHHVFLRTVSQN